MKIRACERSAAASGVSNLADGASKESETRTDSGSERGTSAGYLWTVLCLPLLVLFLAFPLARTNWFLHHNGYPPLRSVGYGDRLKQANCDVVIFGDSTALVGLEPSVVERATGLTACNIAEGMPLLIVNGFTPLDHYLRQNRPPRYLVFMFLPRDFHGIQEWGEPVEGIGYLLRYDLTSQSILKLMLHSSKSFEFAQWAWRAVVTDLVQSAELSLSVTPKRSDTKEDPEDERIRRKGAYNPYHKAPGNACMGPKEAPLPAQAGWIEETRRRYGVNGTTVIFNSAPVPECDPFRDFNERNIRGLHDNTFQALPASMFSDWMHVGLTGSALISEQLGEQIAALEQVAGRGRSQPAE